MFAIPGICALIIFILARPQEFLPLFQKLPFLYLFCAAAIGGFVLDLKLRRLEPVAAPTLPWIAAFIIWATICNAVKHPEALIPSTIAMVIIFTLYGVIAHGAQRFRIFQIISATVMGVCLFLAAVCLHQSWQPRTCVAEDWRHPGEGIPDGRPCELAEDCMGTDAEPGQDYRCEKVGMFGTYSIEDRVRYRGELHDPNELSMTISIGGLAFLVAFAIRKRTAGWIVFATLGGLMVFWTVIETMSRGGMVVALAVGGVYFVKRYGFAGMALGGVGALPLLALGGRSGDAADASTQLRYEAWAAGLQMFKMSPVFGVGARQFGQHHFMTAHNTYVLVLAELGMIGFFIFISILYLSVKILWLGVSQLARVPGAEAARTWGLALLSSYVGLLFQINTLSFAYHSVMWIFLGLASAYWSCVRHHKPDFEVKLEGRDLAAVAAICFGFAFVILPIFLKWKQVA